MAKESKKSKDEDKKSKKLKALKAAKSEKGSKAKKKKKALPTWDAPADFKPFFAEFVIPTDKDGLLGIPTRVTRYTGRYDPNAPDKKKHDMLSYDPLTVGAAVARLAMTTYRSSPDKIYPADIGERNETEKYKTEDGEKKTRMVHRGAKRLPAKQQFKLLLRIGKKKDGVLSASVKTVWQAVKSGSGQVKAKELDKKDPAYRAFRKASRILPAAFKQCLLPPKRGRGGKKIDEDDE